MNRANVSNYEVGRVIPPGNVLRQLAEILHTTTDYIIGRTFNKNNPPVDEDTQIDKEARLIIQKFRSLDARNQHALKT